MGTGAFWHGIAQYRIPGFSVGQIVDIVDDLPVHPTRTYDTRPLADIDTIVIHHSAGSTAVLQSIYSIANYHVNTRNWPGVGYHFCILGDGTVYQTNHLETMSFHSGFHNDHTIGICILGNFTEQPPTEAQIEAAAWLAAWVMGELGRPLDKRPHRFFNETACPGDTWGSWFARI